MRRSQNSITALLVLVLALLPRISLAMNDTDGVIGRGPFPLLGTHKILQILSEEVNVTLTAKGVQVKRSYKIRNNGNSWTFRIGTICSYNNASKSGENCGSVRVDGTPATLTLGTANLIDKGPTVEVRAMSRKNLAKCIEHVDGTICGHVWAYFDTKIQGGKVKQIDLEYTEPLVPHIPIRFAMQATANVFLYTEKFWAGAVVPQITVKFGIQGHPFQPDFLKPYGEYAKYSVEPDGVEKGVLVWRFKNYKPEKRSHTYTFRLLIPNVIDVPALCKAYENLTKKTFCKSRRRR